ncbi:MAG: single-stranded DNA-binding protein [Bacilli bacterium]|nr:single-stranded DNA-binding protein [Bacilli bacterium]
MYNQSTLLGHITRAVELHFLPNGDKVATTAIATNRRFKKQDGTQGEEVMYIDLSFFGKLADIADNFLEAGKRVLIVGHLKLDQWTDQSGGKRSKHFISVDTLQMLDTQRNAAEDQDNIPTPE